MTPTTPIARRLRLTAGSAVVALALAACGSSGSSGSAASTAATSATSATSTASSAASSAVSSSEATATAASALTVSDAWARTSAAMQDAGAAYMKIENAGAADDALVSAKVAATVAMEAQIHEVVPDTTMGATTTAMGGAGTTAMGGAATTAAAGAMGGAMKMQPVDKIVVPAKGSVELKPGGYHVMLMKLAEPLVKGETFDVTLTFASGATQVVTVEVRDEA